MCWNGTKRLCTVCCITLSNRFSGTYYITLILLLSIALSLLVLLFTKRRLIVRKEFHLVIFYSWLIKLLNFTSRTSDIESRIANFEFRILYLEHLFGAFTL
jgi:hypothetical protein